LRTTKASDLLITSSRQATGRTLHSRDTRQAALGQAVGIAVELIA
jgi:hypothetical protein